MDLKHWLLTYPNNSLLNSKQNKLPNSQRIYRGSLLCAPLDWTQFQSAKLLRQLHCACAQTTNKPKCDKYPEFTNQPFHLLLDILDAYWNCATSQAQKEWTESGQPIGKMGLRQTISHPMRTFRLRQFSCVNCVSFDCVPLSLKPRRHWLIRCVQMWSFSPLELPALGIPNCQGRSERMLESYGSLTHYDPVVKAELLIGPLYIAGIIKQIEDKIFTWLIIHINKDTY